MNKGTSMSDWAEREVEIVLDNLKKSIKEDDDFKYNKSVYKDALECYKLITDKGNNTYSNNSVCYILRKLIEYKPLSPIIGKDEEWLPVPEITGITGEFSLYQNIRYYSLFKEVYHDGSVKYIDSERCICVDEKTGENFSFKRVLTILDEIFPITMPYEPKKYEYKVIVKRLYNDRDTGFHVIDILCPNGNTVKVNKYFDRIFGEKYIAEISKSKFEEKYLNLSKKEKE